jgi:hypothetical protein
MDFDFQIEEDDEEEILMFTSALQQLHRIEIQSILKR